MRNSSLSNLNVRLLGCSKDPNEIHYSALQIGKSSEWADTGWKEGRLSQTPRSETTQTIPDRTRLNKSGYVNFIFLVKNISRHCLSELNRFQIVSDGEKMLSPDQQPDAKTSTFLTPPSFIKEENILRKWKKLQQDILIFSHQCSQKGIKKEDTELCLPAGLLSNEQFSFSFQAMQKFLDNGMCEGVYWEIREMSWQIYRIMEKEFPSLSDKLGIKCWENRRLFCDEENSTYESCKYRKTRPHRQEFAHLWKENGLSQVAQR